jgi:hypothetical protein
MLQIGTFKRCQAAHLAIGLPGRPALFLALAPRAARQILIKTDRLAADRLGTAGAAPQEEARGPRLTEVSSGHRPPAPHKPLELAAALTVSAARWPPRLAGGTLKAPSKEHKRVRL